MSRPELREWLWRCACCDYNPWDWTKCACGMKRPPLPGIAEGIREGMERAVAIAEGMKEGMSRWTAYAIRAAAAKTGSLRTVSVPVLPVDEGDEALIDGMVARAAAKAGKERG